ncbi:MAG: hypothetical protein VB050_16530 [Geobacteraceae bacterium]|nr:hypothetical protein [Geobacteraceae bacterium]
MSEESIEKDMAIDSGKSVELNIDFKPEELNESENQRIQGLRTMLDDYYVQIPDQLRDLPGAQERCLELLSAAEQYLTPPIYRSDIINARLALARIDIEIRRSKSAKSSFGIVVSIVYLFAALIFIGFQMGIFSVNIDGKTLNSSLVMGIPLPIIIWSIIGSITSMLIRAGNFPFADRTEALRWLFFRPIVGLVMGVLTYLMVVAGLIVFAGNAKPQTPELLWVIAFVGSFSDTLSINLLEKLLGKFEVARFSKKTDEKSGAVNSGERVEPPRKGRAAHT